MRPQRSKATPAAVASPGKPKAAIEAMIWEGLERKVAAKGASMRPTSVSRCASRTSSSTITPNWRHFAPACELATCIAWSKNGMARVAAVKAMEAIADQADEKQRPGSAILPGLQIVIVNGTTAPVNIPPQTIDHEAARAE